MARSAVVVVAVIALGACGGGSKGNNGGGGNPIAPAPVVTSVAVTFPTGGTIFIGSTSQFQARETLNDGTTRVSGTATWGSDTPGVATVSSSGLVAAVGAGEATIFADAGMRGTLLIRVFPRFSGDWSGDEVVAGCQDSGDFRGICGDPELAIGVVYAHDSTFTQNEGQVGAAIDGGGIIATTTGTVSLGGGLELAPALFVPTDLTIELRTWRSRADQPGRMTGTYEIAASHRELQGSFALTVRLNDVRRTSAVQGEPASRSVGRGLAVRRIADRLREFADAK